jgi:FeS assembly protein IscX
MKKTWQDIAELARDLAERHPDLDPLAVTPAELKRLVAALPSFGDDASAATPTVLDALLAAWYDAREN